MFQVGYLVSKFAEGIRVNAELMLEAVNAEQNFCELMSEAAHAEFNICDHFVEILANDSTFAIQFR